MSLTSLWQRNLKKFESSLVKKKIFLFSEQLDEIWWNFWEKCIFNNLKSYQNTWFQPLAEKDTHLEKPEVGFKLTLCITYLGRFLYRENWVYNFLISSERFFEFHCSPLNFIYRACFEQGDTLHSSNGGVYIHS